MRLKHRQSIASHRATKRVVTIHAVRREKLDLPKLSKAIIELARQMAAEKYLAEHPEEAAQLAVEQSSLLSDHSHSAGPTVSRTSPLGGDELLPGSAENLDQVA